jgi:hypothetical protein
MRAPPADFKASRSSTVGTRLGVSVLETAVPAVNIEAKRRVEIEKTKRKIRALRSMVILLELSWFTFLTRIFIL